MNERAEAAVAARAKLEDFQPNPIELAADLSHQLEEAREQINTLIVANREQGILTMRAEAARDALKGLIMEALKR